MDTRRRRTRVVVAAALVVGLVVGLGGCTADRTPPTPDDPPSTSPPASPVTTPTGSPTPTPSPSLTPTPSAPVEVTRKNPGDVLDRIDQRRLPLDQRFRTFGQGEGVTVYVVDGLFDVSNAELGGRASVGLKSGRACTLEDGINHGLFVAGLVAGRRTGVAPRATLVSVGSSNGCEGYGGSDAKATARIVRALDWVAAHAHRPAVVNLSLNADAPAPTIAAATQRLVAADLTVVVSAGNDGGDACAHPPAGLPGVVTVAASTRTDRDAGLNHERCVDLFAPAEGVTSVVDPALSPTRLATADGAATSWAAPLVSGRPPCTCRSTRTRRRRRYEAGCATGRQPGCCAATSTGRRTGCCTPVDRSADEARPGTS